MTIRETTVIRKKFYPFVKFNLKPIITFLSLCLFFVFSNSTGAQEDTTIASDNFEDVKPVINTSTEKPQDISVVKANVIKETPDLQKSSQSEEKVISKEEKPTDEQKPVIEKNNELDSLKASLAEQQAQLKQLTQSLSAFAQQNKALENKLSLLQKAFDEQAKLDAVQAPDLIPNKHPKLKAQVINLAIQTSLLKAETAKPKDKKSTPSEESAWYEKLVVVKKIDKNQETPHEKIPLYAVLKQFDLLQLALDEKNQQQWQETLQTITTTLQNQYSQQAQSIIGELKTLQSQNITAAIATKNAAVDSKFGIK